MSNKPGKLKSLTFRAGFRGAKENPELGKC